MQKEQFSFVTQQTLKQTFQTIIQKIPQDFKYIEELKNRFQIFIKDFNKKNKQVSINYEKDPSKLKILFKTQNKKQQNEEPKPKQNKFADPNIFIYSYQLPYGYEKFQFITRDQQTQKRTDQIIDKYQIREKIHQNENFICEMIYLSYKRVMLISPRQFVYLRLFVKHVVESQKQKKNWIVTFSIPYETGSTKKRGQIILTVTQIKQNSQTQKSQLKVFSQVDMKMAVKPQMAKSKGFTQIRKYVQKLYKEGK